MTKVVICFTEGLIRKWPRRSNRKVEILCTGRGDESRQAEMRRLASLVRTSRLGVVPGLCDSVALSSGSLQGLQSVVSVSKPLCVLTRHGANAGHRRGRLLDCST
jgi:hypothetical protein